MADDMDLDELLGNPSQGSNRPGRFAPKGSRFKPKPKTEASDSGDSLPVPKKEDDGAKPVMKPESSKTATDMDVEVKPDVKEVEGDQSEDEVVREIDVYFTPSIDPHSKLYLLQFPHRPCWRPYELDEKTEEVRVNREGVEVEIDLTIDVNSKNYDSGADPKLLITKQTLLSKWTPPHTSGCAVGVLTGNKLHLNLIHAVLQLRTSKDYLDSDSKGSKRKTSVRSNGDDAVKLEGNQETKPSGTSKKLTKILEQTKDMGEVWVPLKYHSVRSDMAAGYQQKMMEREGSQIYFSMSSHDYLNSLCPGTSTDSFSSIVPSKRSLLALPLKERFKTWLLEGPPVHKFDTLKHLAPDESLDEVLAVLQEHARLVQGLWVPKSSLVYGKDHGVEVLCRDYVLLQFSKNATFKKFEIPSKQLLHTQVTEVLKVLATERTIIGDYKLKEPPDLTFNTRYPSVAKKQEIDWECLEKSISDFIGGRNVPGLNSSSKSSTTNPTTSKVLNKPGARTPSGSRTEMSSEDREATVKALQKLFKREKVCSYQLISQQLRDLAISESVRSTGFAKEAVAAANSIDDFPNELQAIISQVAVNIHGICVPISSPDNKKFDPFRRVVIDLFLAEGPNGKLKKATIFEAAKMKLEREVSQIEYQKVLQELCVSQGSSWVLRGADQI